MDERSVPFRTPFSGFAVSPGRGTMRRRMLERLRPDGGFIALDLELIEIVEELDPGMIDWKAQLR